MRLFLVSFQFFLSVYHFITHITREPDGMFFHHVGFVSISALDLNTAGTAQKGIVTDPAQISIYFLFLLRKH